ncbi:MAG: DUF305 domain-containing protein [Candidatus Altimarinota bacterium]
MDKSMNSNHYGRLVIMIVLSFLSMYALMYAMVDSIGNVYANLNQFYMAGLMTAPMVVIEMLLMGGMYENKKINAVIIGGSIISAIIFFMLIRQQVGITDKQFLESMIPHHGGAVLMCGQATISDPEIKQLCETIITGQQAEIDQMKAKLSEL